MRLHRLYVLLLEGRVRFNVHQVAAEGTPFYLAKVSVHGPSDAATDLALNDTEFVNLAAAFRDAARKLVERCV